MALSGSMTRFYQLCNDWLYAVGPNSEEYIPDFSITFSWEVIHKDVVNNKSTIKWELRATALNEFEDMPNHAYLQYNEIPEYICFGTEAREANSSSGRVHDDVRIKIRHCTADLSQTIGQDITVYTRTDLDVRLYKNDTNVLIDSGTFEVEHEDDGTRGLQIDCRCRVKNVFDVNDVALAGNRTDMGDSYSAINWLETTLDTISRHAVIYTDEELEVKDFTDEDTVAINYAVPSGITGYIYLSLDGNANTETTELHPVTGAGTHNYSFSPNDQKKLWTIQPVLTKRVKFFIKSVSPIDGKEYREPSNDVNLSIANFMPTLDPDVWDNNTNCVQYLTGNSRVMVRHVSEPHFNTGGDPKKGASIEIQSCTHGGVTEKGATGKFTTVSGDATTANFDFIITDNYGRTTSGTTQFSTSVGNYVPYVKLTCSAEATPMTGDGDVTVTLTGKFFKGSFSSSKQNRMRMSIDLYRNNEEVLFNDDWGYIDRDSGYNASSGKQATFTYNASDSSYTYEFTLDELEYLSVYELYITLSDEVTTLSASGTQAQTILAAVPIFDWSRTDFAFYVPVTIQEATVPTIVAQSLSDSGWSYRKWSDGTAECWRTLTVNSAIATGTNASWYSSGEKSTTNLSYPFAFIARPMVTVQAMPTGSSYCIVFPSNTAGSTTKTGSYQLMSMTSQTARDHLLSYHVKGRWK